MDSYTFNRVKKLGIPLVFKEGDAIIELNPDGTKRIIKYLPKLNITLPAKFKLK